MLFSHFVLFSFTPMAAAVLMVHYATSLLFQLAVISSDNPTFKQALFTSSCSLCPYYALPLVNMSAPKLQIGEITCLNEITWLFLLFLYKIKLLLTRRMLCLQCCLVEYPGRHFSFFGNVATLEFNNCFLIFVYSALLIWYQ